MHTKKDTETLMKFVENAGLKETTLSFDKRLVASLILKHNPEITNHEIQDAMKFLDDRGIGHPQIADARATMDVSKRKTVKTTVTVAPVTEPVTVAPVTEPVIATEPISPASAPIAVPDPIVVLSPAAVVEAFRWGDRVEAVAGEYFGAVAVITKFGKSKRDGKPGARLKPVNGGSEFWTDTENLRKVRAD